MLKIIRSGFSSFGREHILSSVKALVEEGRRSYLIVPEQQTVMAEGEMSKKLPPSAPLSFEVTNFTRLANTTFRSLGGISGEYCDNGKKALVMWRALTELSPVLTMTAGRKEISAGLVARALGAVSEMESLGIGPEQLLSGGEAPSVMEDKRLSGKLSDLSKIYTLYKTLLKEKYADTGEDCEAMVRKLSENPRFLADAEIFIDGFTSFTEPQYRLIGLLIRRCTVTVSLAISAMGGSAFEYTEVRAAEERLISSARAAGVDIKLIAPKGMGERDFSFSSFAEYIWQNDETLDNKTLQNAPKMRIFEARTPFEECEFVAADIKRRVMEGDSFCDFAIVARGADKYSGILDTALSMGGIPAFTAFGRDISSFEIIKLIYTAYAVAKGGFTREDVLTYAKCGLSGISREECDEFESYVEKWQINGSRFTDGVVWNMNPAGYSQKRPKGTEDKLLRIHKVRMKLVEPLCEFSGEVKMAKTVREQATVLLNFLCKLDAEQALRARRETLLFLGEIEASEENGRLWGLITDALDAVVEVMGDSPADGETFLGQLKILFSNVDMGKIPAHLDEVTVGSADMLRLYGKKHVYLIGVNAGEFPQAVSDNSYFSERDKEILSAIGLPIKPELEIKGARELYIFARAISYAEESLTLLYSTADTSYKAIERADVINKISALTGGAVTPVKISTLGVSQRLYNSEGALMALGGADSESAFAIKDALLRAGHGKAVKICEGNIANATMTLGEEVRRGIYDKPLSLTQTRIDSFVGCPFNYFCKFNIGLSEDKRAELDAPGIGSFIHAILENFFRALTKEGRRAGELTREEKETLTRRAAEKYIGELGENTGGGSVRTKIKLERLCRAAMPVVEGLCEEFSGSLFEPRFFELSIKGNDDSIPDPVTFKTAEGKEIKVYGIIDRVDTYKKGDDVYIRVIDYKTGHKEFSPDDLAEGSNLQMFLYLKAIVDTEKAAFLKAAGVTGEGRLIPAGVIYVKTSVNDVRVDTPDDDLAAQTVKDNQGREGMVLGDDDVISAMGLRYTPLYSARTPNKISEAKKKYLYTEEGWDGLMKTMEATISSIASKMSSGDVSATPKADKRGDTSCEYCEFKAICRSAKIK